MSTIITVFSFGYDDSQGYEQLPSFLLRNFLSTNNTKYTNVWQGNITKKKKMLEDK